ncbi:hypothetical protein GQX74_008620 [Glossina fuscipes]|nr:hypothetical protein GQX74_008620 [Glossina fuscipes]
MIYIYLQSYLPKGISSTVRRCIEKETGKEFAAKIIDLGAATETGETNPLHMLEATRQEISILRQVMGHPYIIDLQDVFESDAFVFLVFELCPKGELFDYLTSVVTLSEKKTRTIMRQIFEGVEYIHSKNIVHRDLKPENILLDDLCGTPGYLAPETLKCNMFEGSPGYSQEVDIWACGVIMFTLLVGCPPFWHRKQMVMLRNIMEGKYSFTSPEWADISGTDKLFLKSLSLHNNDQYLNKDEERIESISEYFLITNDSKTICFLKQDFLIHTYTYIAISYNASTPHFSSELHVETGKLQTEPYQAINDCYASKDPKDLIRKCLVVDPIKRITVQEVLRHPFFNQMMRLGSEKLEDKRTNKQI